ncbi:MAG: divergent polysaccharide deacetylase family protein [Magnetospirillum sp.]|nr:divergent polysaccharide deacetylase family protein [Magnetospirillum sp.]
MLSLDDDDGLMMGRPVGVDETPPRAPINLRPFLLGLLVVVLGGGLGTAAYFLSDMDTRDVIALLDIGDQPKLSLEMPRGDAGKPHAPAPVPTGSGLLTPPGSPSMVPLPQGEAAGVAAMPMTPPLKPEPVPALPIPAPPSPLPAVAAPAATPAPSAMPEQPLPRNPDQPPTYASLPARQGEAKPLPPAPLEPLLRQSAYGPLPVVGRDGRQAWKAYGRPFDAPAGKPRVGVIVTGLGLDKDGTEAAIAKLPPDVTLAFSPYAGSLDKWVKKARDAGHEVMLVLPTEPPGFPARDPGPWGLLTANQVEENIGRLERVLGRASGYVGVLAPDGGFTRSPKLAPVLMALKERGLLYVGDGAKAEAGLPVATVTAVLDSDSFRDAIEARLTLATRTALETGQGMVVISPRPVVFDRLVGWLDRLGEQGIVLAPASGIVKQSGK